MWTSSRRARVPPRSGQVTSCVGYHCKGPTREGNIIVFERGTAGLGMASSALDGMFPRVCDEPDFHEVCLMTDLSLFKKTILEWNRIKKLMRHWSHTMRRASCRSLRPFLKLRWSSGASQPFANWIVLKRWSSMQTLGNTPIRPESYWIARGQGVSNMAKHTQPKDLQPSMKFVAVCQTRDPKRIHSEVWSMTFTLLPAMLQGRRNWGLGEVPYRVLRSMRVSSLCKLGGYRSLKKHLSCAKDHHVTLVYAGRNFQKMLQIGS